MFISGRIGKKYILKKFNNKLKIKKLKKNVVIYY